MAIIAAVINAVFAPCQKYSVDFVIFVGSDILRPFHRRDDFDRVSHISRPYTDIS